MNTEERFKRLFEASPEQLAAIDSILEGKNQNNDRPSTGPLLMGMNAAAKFIGVSRTTLWRMIENKSLEKVEILPGSYRLRRADLEAIADKRNSFATSDQLRSL